MDPRALLDGVRRDVERSVLRARNGLRYLTSEPRQNVGLTPKEVVWQQDRARLFRYRSDTRSRRRPLVIVFSIMGRSYVLDLRPGSSFVEWMLQHGHDVFLVDFGEPEVRDSMNTLETYVDIYLPHALRAAMTEADSDEVDVLGYCFGGVLATLAVAGHPQLPITSLAAMATPMDFSRMGGLLDSVARGQIEVDDVLDESGNVPPEAVLRMFRMQKPTAPLTNYATLLERMWDDEFVDGFQAMSMWARDQIPFPGALARQATEVLLRENALMTGRVRLGDRVVDLAAITQPVLAIIAEHDHLVRPDAARPLLDLVGSEDTTELLIPAGHIGLATGRHAVRTTIPELTAWLTSHDS